jgi:CRISPR-associated protein Csx14
MPAQEIDPPALIATLGLQPQVITRALDCLLEKDPDIIQGTIIHTAAFRSHPNWPTFETFRRYIETRYEDIDWQWVPIEDGDGRVLNDVNTPEAAELAFKVIFNATKALKRQGYRLHGLIAGGRKSIIVYSMISAQLLFDVRDKLWHLFSDDENSPNHELSRRPHIPSAKLHLVEIPVLHLAGLMPMVRELILYGDDPTRALRLYQEHDDMERLVQLQRFYDECEPVEQRILWLRFHNLPNADVSERVFLSTSAVHGRLNSIADRFYSDPALGSRYTQKPPKPYRAVLIALRPILSRIEQEPQS